MTNKLFLNLEKDLHRVEFLLGEFRRGITIEHNNTGFIDTTYAHNHLDYIIYELRTIKDEIVTERSI